MPSIYTVKYSPTAKAEGSNVSSTTVTADTVNWINGYLVFSLTNGTVQKMIRQDLVDEVVFGT